MSAEHITREINRRHLLELMAAAGAGMLIGCGGGAASSTTTTTISTGTSSASCVLLPPLTIGPYFVDGKLNRSELTPDTNDVNVTEALPLALAITVQQYNSSVCNPLSGAQVDLWHADAGGKYSDENSEGTTGEPYLRGIKSPTPAAPSFKTIFPDGTQAARFTFMSWSVCSIPPETRLRVGNPVFFRSHAHHANHGDRALQHPRHSRHQQQPGQYLFAEWPQDSAESHPERR